MSVVPRFKRCYQNSWSVRFSLFANWKSCEFSLCIEADNSDLDIARIEILMPLLQSPSSQALFSDESLFVWIRMEEKCTSAWWNGGEPICQPLLNEDSILLLFNPWQTIGYQLVVGQLKSNELPLPLLLPASCRTGRWCGWRWWASTRWKWSQARPTRLVPRSKGEQECKCVYKCLF